MDGGGRLPEGEQLPLGANLRAAYEESGDRLLKSIVNALTAASKSLDDVAADIGIDPAQLSRVLHGRSANIPPRLLAYAAWHDRAHLFVREVCALAGGEFKPKPPKSVEEKYAALRAALMERGLWDVAKEWTGDEP